MGQYYTPIALQARRNTPKAVWYSHDYDNGLKLMEHSYIGNNLCNSVEHYLIDRPHRLVWAGDYADDEKGKDYNLYTLADRSEYEDRFVKPTEENQADIPSGYFVINHTKKEYYSRDALRPFDKWDGYDITINPLPLMTCEGNGRGGGDYRGDDGSDNIGRWARNLIELSTEVPEGYTEIHPYFAE